MAALERHYGVYRIVFRFGGKQLRRSLKTNKEQVALASLSRAEENLRRLELGQLSLPPGADVVSFILSDGRLEQRPQLKLNEFPTLGALLDEFLRTITPGVMEPTTEHCIRIHIRHLRKMFGEKFPVRSMDLDAIQKYVDARSAAKGFTRTTSQPYDDQEGARDPWDTRY